MIVSKLNWSYFLMPRLCLLVSRMLSFLIWFLAMMNSIRKFTILPISWKQSHYQKNLCFFSPIQKNNFHNPLPGCPVTFSHILNSISKKQHPCPIINFVLSNLYLVKITLKFPIYQLPIYLIKGQPHLHRDRTE